MTGNQNRQQQPQVPVNQQQNQVPDHRIDEVMKELQTLKLQNAQLRGTVDYLQRGPQQGQPQEQSPAFKPEVQTAIDARVKSMIEPLQNQFKQQVGYLADQLDDANYRLKYGGEKFAKFQPKVEQVRQQAMAENRYLTREQALQLVHFEETGVKNPTPEPQQQQVQQQPVFDPYFNGYVDPVTRKPVQPGQEQVQEQTQEEPQTQIQPQWQQQQAPQQQPMPNYGNQQPGAGQRGVHPNGNAFGQNPQNQFQLPNQGMNPQAPAHQARDGRAPLDLTSSEADFQAFEENFGDIPL